MTTSGRLGESQLVRNSFELQCSDTDACLSFRVVRGGMLTSLLHALTCVQGGEEQVLAIVVSAMGVCG